MSHAHDHPLHGHFTSFFADSFGGTLGFGNMTDAEIDKAFKDMDTKEQGFLDKCEIGDALRHHGKSEKEIQRFVDNMEADTLTLEEFRELCKGKAQPLTHDIGGISVPNLAKVHDIPIFGGITKATHNLVKEGGGSVLKVTAGDAIHDLSDVELKKKFDEMDDDKDGTINAKEIAAALRKLKVQEKDIKAIKDQVGDAQLDWIHFKVLVRNKVGGAGHIHDHPVVGHVTGFLGDTMHAVPGVGSTLGNHLGWKKMTEEEMKAAFLKMDTKGQGFLDKGEIHDALHDHGMPERDIQHLMDDMEEDTLDFEAFKALVTGKKPQPHTHDVSVPGGFSFPVPNVHKVHEVPVLGGVTQAVHKTAKGVHSTVHAHAKTVPGVGGAIAHVSSTVKGSAKGKMGEAFTQNFGKMTDAELHKKFDEIDTLKIGKLNKSEVAVALRQLKLKEADIKSVTVAIGDDYITFDEFKDLCHQGAGTAPMCPKTPAIHKHMNVMSHDHPVGGHVTSFFTDLHHDSLGLSKMTDEEIDACFKKMDTNNQGCLDKCEIGEALRHHGKTEKQIQRYIDDMDKDTLNLEEFRAMCKGTNGRKHTMPVQIGPSEVHVPNLEKVHDIPMLGGITGATHNLVKEGGKSLAGGTIGGAFNKLSDKEMYEKFKEMDETQTGQINAKEIAKALRKLKVPETEIKKMKEQIGDSELTFPEFKHLIKKNSGSSHMHDHPVAGHVTGFLQDGLGDALGFEKMTEEEMREAFDNVDLKKTGKLDKMEVHEALHQHGMADRDIQHLLDAWEEDEFDFVAFKDVVRGKAQPMTTPVQFGGTSVHLPNLLKLHEVPVLGGITAAAHKAVVHGHGAAMSHAGDAFSGAFGKMSDAQLKQKFDEIDTEGMGKLNKREVARALRKLKMKEADIKGATAPIGDDLIDFEGFKKLCGH